MQGVKVGLALGAGAARGAAHLGVIAALLREGIPIDVVAGTSAGSLVGAVYAAGMELERVIQLATHLSWDHLVELTVPRMGLIKGNKLLQFIRLITRNKTFADLKIPFAAVAMDIESGEEVVISEGLVADAVRASCSIPGVFVPHRIGERLLVDGGVINRVPINVARQLGADIVIGVDVGDSARVVKVNNIIDVIMQSIDIMEREIHREKVLTADVLIQPDLGPIASTNLEAATSCIAAGEAAAVQALPRIRELMEIRRIDNQPGYRYN
ncbi:MAG: patatin-like phospholipase family protein [Firmicutes bacterium]|nr:patatin-like phospholipase family protein [Bacillota bacterium]